MVSVDRLKNLKIFHDSPRAFLEKLSGDITEKTYSNGQTICREGEPGGSLYIIESGRVVIEKKSFSGEASSKVVARLSAGEFFGEMAFLQATPHSATVLAQEETVLFLLSRASMDELIKRDPTTAFDQISTVAMGLSNRLRSTTRELVTVFEIAKALSSSSSIGELANHITGQLHLDLGAQTSVGFYRWNPFNDEYARLATAGRAERQFPTTIDPGAATDLSFPKGTYIASRIDMLDVREGLLVYLSEKESAFDAGERQMMETVAAVLAPALSSARHREEEGLRQRLQQNKQSEYGS